MIETHSCSCAPSQEAFEARPKLLGSYDSDMPKRKPARAVSVEENEHLRAVARALMAERYGGNQTRLAKALGVEQAFVSDFLLGKRGAGVAMIRGLERLAASSTLASALRRGLEDPFPARRVVVELARGEGVAESVLLALASDVLPGKKDPGEDYWQARLVALEQRRRKMAGELEPADPKR